MNVTKATGRSNEHGIIDYYRHENSVTFALLSNNILLYYPMNFSNCYGLRKKIEEGRKKIYLRVSSGVVTRKGSGGSERSRTGGSVVSKLFLSLAYATHSDPVNVLLKEIL